MNKVKSYIHLFIVLTSFSLVVASCAIPPATVSTQTNNRTHLPLTATAISHLESTQASTFPFHVNLSCWKTNPLQTENEIQGSLTLGYHSSYFYYWDVSTFHIKSFPGTVDSTGRVPFQPSDGSYIPLFLPKEKKINLIFFDESSVTLNLFPAEDYRFSPLLDGNLLIAPWDDITTRPTENKNYQEGIGYTDTYYIYSSKTGERIEEHSVLLPNSTFFSEARNYLVVISYSPDGHYVLYLSRSSDGNGNDMFSLLDLRSNDVKWSVPVSKQIGGAVDEGPAIPSWKPDGSGLTYIWTSDDEGKEQNFYNISLDGIVSQFTRLEGVFPPGYILGFNPQWSPDGRYLVFKVQSKPYTSDADLDIKTFIWDDVDKTLLNPCLQADISVPLSVEGADWSFDSKHIAISLPIPLNSDLIGSERHWRNLVLDIPGRVIYELPDDEAMRDYLKITDDKFSYRIGSWINWETP